MKDYAIHFAEWILHSNYVPIIKCDTNPCRKIWYYTILKINVEPIYLTTQELYQIYSDEQDLKEKLKYEKDTN